MRNIQKKQSCNVVCGIECVLRRFSEFPIYYHFTKMSRRHLHIVALLGMLILRIDLVFAYGCEWTGKMPGPGGGGSCPSPVQSETCPVTPSYEELQSMKVLWPCPNATKQTGEKYYGACTPGSGNSPLCYNFNPATCTAIRLLLPQ